LGELGYGFAYRVLDAQYFGVPQRRKRVFVIGCLGDFGSAAAVLFEQHSLQGHSAPRRETRQEVTEIAGTLAANGGGLDRPAGQGNELDFCIAVYSSYNPARQEGNAVISYALAGNLVSRGDKCTQNESGIYENFSPTLTRTDVHAVAHAFKVRGGCEGGGKGYLGQDEQAFTLSTGADQQLFHKMQVRRFMPIECERLQGFSDNFTNIPSASDSARYKALGNSMAVPVMRWIGERINLIESMQLELAA